ncbi:MAG TPA: molybdopterin converting factor subunit 1 [Ktedonobacterales bacterium]
MRVTVRYFAALRELAGRPSEALDMPVGATAGAVRMALASRHPAMAGPLSACAVAVNQAYSDLERTLEDGDELAFLPPLGGG